MDNLINPDGTKEELELVKVNINAPLVDMSLEEAEKTYPKQSAPVARIGQMLPRPKPIYLGRRREKELKMEFKRVKKGLIKHLNRTNNSIVTNRLCEGEMKLIKEEAISIIERKVNGNTTNK